MHERLWQKRLDREARDPRMDPSRGESWQVGALRGGLRALGLYERGVANVLSPVVRRVEFLCGALPAAFDGFRILHLSDFHLPGPPGLLEAIAGAIAESDCADCDLCALTGDFAFNRRTDTGGVADTLERLLAPVGPRHGFAAVPGNNDTSKMIELLRRMGLRVLVNEHFELVRGGDRMYVAGVDDPHEFRCASVLESVCGIPERAFTLLLAHSPECAVPAARAGAGAYLCGHTHGGQICLPGGHPLFINTRCPRSRASGAWRVRQMPGYTTRGLGASTIEVRYACPPDAAVVTLRRA